MSAPDALILRTLGTRDYEPVWREMQAFNAARTPLSPDELWQVEHPPVFTLGLNARPEHLLSASDIPVVRIDRGGQVTYHGPGQAVVYCLIDLRRRGIGVKAFVELMEQAVIDLLQQHGISGERLSGAPGVYVGGAKIAALGLRVTRAGCYHGIALNVAMDLAPYAHINPCGYAGMAVTQVADFVQGADVTEWGARLAKRIAALLDPGG